jgi:hypothetical protein
MDTVQLFGGVYRGTHYGSMGVYTNEYGHTYAGAHKDGVAHGFGVFTNSGGNTYSGQFADGRWHGHCETHLVIGDVSYELFERGHREHLARVRRDGACFYDRQPCGADHADFAALKAAAQQAGVRMPPTRIQRKPAPSAEPDAHAVSGFVCTRSVLVPGVGPRLWACACKCARVCACVRVRVCVRVVVRASVCVHNRVGVSVCVNLCARVSVHMRLGVCERVYACEFVYVCA